MSRGYRVSWPQAAIRWVVERDTVTASEQRSLTVDLLPILEQAEMAALTHAALRAAGWRAEGEETVTEMQGATVRLTAKGDQIVVRLEGERAVSGRARDAGGARQALAAKKQGAEEDLAEELARRVARLEGGLHDTLNAVVQRVYVEALKRKAARLGEITSVHEGGADGAVELTIKVKV